MQENAKTVAQCDSCKQPLPLGKNKKNDKDELIETIQATLNMPNGETKDFDFCDEECLRQFLNARKKKNTKASIDINLKNNTLCSYTI